MDLFGEDIPEETNTVEEDLTDANAAPTVKEGLQHPREMHICLGHEKVEKHLIDLWASDGQVPHALVFSGPKGIGKATMAYRFARFLFRNGLKNTGSKPQNMAVAPDEPIARRVASGGCPDLMSVERPYDPAKNRYKDIVNVAEIRKIPSFIRMTASEGSWRIVIIDDADTMNRNAQNALLKILEEPPENTLLILVTHRPGALIPTIKSRVQTISFQPLSKDIVAELLRLNGTVHAPEETEALYQLCEGSIGKALQLIQEGGLETLGQTLEAFRTYPSWDRVSLHNLADSLGSMGRDQQFKTFQEIMAWIFTNLTRAKARGQGIAGTILGRPPLEGLLKNASLEQLLEICENLEDHFYKVNAANLDKRQAVLNAFSMIKA